ncbi:hypothetical protein F5Y14DRAFT_423265 [Nemania sp. NC0429]|nr:hypothetical protein F5Y14DRAFT_423265 [Nemania sp. NC0429]
MLRLQKQADGDGDNNHEPFTVAVGVHNYRPWVHAPADVAPAETTVVLLPQYYAGGKHSGVAVVPACEVQNGAGRRLSAAFRVAGVGPDYALDQTSSLADYRLPGRREGG